MKRKSCFFPLFLVQIVVLSAHPYIVESRLDSIPNEQKQDTVIINDNASLIKEDSLYDITVDFVRRIKNAYYIGGHLNIADTMIYVKILEPKTKVNGKGSKIRIGDVYEMRLFRYYPYSLRHPIDYYYNYNFLFGGKVVCLQATDCLNLIFSTDNLLGLHYYNEDSSSKSFLHNLWNDIQGKETASMTFWSIIQKDNHLVDQFVDFSAVRNCLIKMSCPYSVVNHQQIRCLPPFVVRNHSGWIKNATRGHNLSDVLFYVTTSPYLNQYASTEIVPSVKIDNIDVVYYNDKSVTYRILWKSSLLPPVHWCTYLSFKKNKKNIKLTGISSFETIL